MTVPSYRRYLAALSALCLVSCLAAGQPRPAEVAAPGQWSFDAYVPLGTVGFASVDAVHREPGTNEQTALSIDGPTTGLEQIVGTGPPPFWWEVSGRIGVVAGCELAVMVGFFRLGGEGRCALLDQRKGAPLSAAVGLAAAYQPFYHRGGPWWRGSLDLSKRLGKHYILMLNTYVSQGPEGRILVGGIPEEYWDLPPDPNVSHQASAAIYAVRDEWRISPALGVGITLKGKYAAVVGVVPYFIVDTDRLSHVECNNCNEVEVDAFRERFGFSVVVGMTRLLP